MARPTKHPGLQQKFESVLLELLAGGKSLKAKELVNGARKLALKYQIDASELEDLEANFANYATRAKDGGVIMSGGPWVGYQLCGPSGHALTGPGGSLQPGPPSSENPAARQDTEVLAGAIAERRRHWESFLHFPLTVALSAHFSSRVVSLPNATDSVRWGNPDMLMLRPSPLARVQEFDPGLDPAAFRSVDVSPECILASIEVKGGLDRDRAKLFTAIAEAAANSRWANEAWLVFTDWDATDQGLDEDVVSLARSVEVGLLEVRLFSDAYVLRTTVHHAAPTRSTLRIGELRRDRVGVLQAAQELLKVWQLDEATFLDIDRAEQKARLLLQQALRNLRTQKGFTAAGSVADLVRPLRVDDAKYVDGVLRASLQAAALAAGVDVASDLAALVANAADDTLVKKEADALRNDLEAFGETTLSARKPG